MNKYLNFRILFQDEHILAVNKLPSELTVAGAGKVEKKSLLDFLQGEYGNLYALHRLDFETSGVVVFARTKPVQKAVLASKFTGWKKYYKALVLGDVKKKSGVISIPLEARSIGKIDAVTTYKVLERYGDLTLVEAQIETGRHHQIRKHFAKINHPLILDSVYGNKKMNGKFSRIFRLHKFFLHASRLELPHPITGEKLTIEAPMPRVFETVLENLR